MADNQNPNTDDANTDAKRGGSMTSRILIGSFMCAFVVIECLLAYFLIPSADEVAAIAQTKMAEKLEDLDPDTDSTSNKDTKAVVEVDLGSYSVTAHQPTANTSLRIDFHLYGTVLEEREDDFATAFLNSEHRFRDQILFEIRNSSITDLTDPGLGLIKRRILEKSNNLFGEPMLRSIVFSDFSFVEQ